MVVPLLGGLRGPDVIHCNFERRDDYRHALRARLALHVLSPKHCPLLLAAVVQKHRHSRREPLKVFDPVANC
jgi:hypothetical protein